jgi:hypothetical protein
MKLIDNWRQILKHAWSIRMSLLALVFAGLEAGLPVFSDTIPHGPFLLLTMLVTVASGVSRLIDQPKMRQSGKSDG